MYSMKQTQRVIKKPSHADAVRGTMGFKLLGEYRHELVNFHEAFYLFSKGEPEIEIDVLTKINQNQNLFRNYEFTTLGMFGAVVKEAIARSEYTSDKLLGSSYDDRLQVVETALGWHLEDVIDFPNRLRKPDRVGRLILSADGRNWFGGMARRETEIPTFGVEGEGDYLESIERNWDKFDNNQNRKVVLSNIRNVITQLNS